MPDYPRPDEPTPSKAMLYFERHHKPISLAGAVLAVIVGGYFGIRDRGKPWPVLRMPTLSK